MSFILSENRDENLGQAFKRYREYLRSIRTSFPASVFELASSDWYFSFDDHRCPHDAWLESVTISEPSHGDRHEVRATSIRIRLLGAYHDGFIEFWYPLVYSYCFDAPDSRTGLSDWRYDEFRRSDRGHVVHEIEWRGFESSARWNIECSDVEYRWLPKNA